MLVDGFVLADLNRDYHTLHPVDELPRIYDAVAPIVAARGWWDGEPLRLLGASDSEAGEIAAADIGISWLRRSTSGP